MENATWWLIVTAIAIPVGNAIFAGILGLVAAHVGRNATQYAANLQAAQRRRDIEIDRLERAREELSTAATAIQNYAWYVDKSIRLRKVITPEQWLQSREHVQPAVVGAQKLRAIAPTLPTESLRIAYIAVEDLIMDVVSGTEDGRTDLWHEATTNQPDPITRAMTLSAAELKRLYDTYPAGSTKEIAVSPTGNE